MLDAVARRIIDRPLDAVGKRFAGLGIRANTVSVLGFGVGLVAIPALALEAYGLALTFILTNRVLDGLDGAVARYHGATDFGAYLDIVFDFIFYSGVVLGFAWAEPDYALPAAFLMFCFMASGSTFLAFAILAAKHGETTEERGRKSIYYLGGLTEGTETILFFVFVCLLPDFFPVVALIFGILCLITATTRMEQARALATEFAGD